MSDKSIFTPKRLQTVVKVVRALPREKGGTPKVLVHGRNGAYPAEMEPTPEVLEALGNDLFAYFNGERIEGVWQVGARLPASLHRNW